MMIALGGALSALFAVSLPWAQAFSISAGIEVLSHQPVHETMTLAALIASEVKLRPNATYKDIVEDREFEVLEILRGVLWNDDPANALFEDYKETNYVKNTGAEWAVNFAHAMIFSPDANIDGDIWRDNMIARAHLGDLQFLHSMANDAELQPSSTREKIMTWLELTYKVAIGEIPATTRLRDMRINHANGSHAHPLRELFDYKTRPRDTDSFHTLITSDTTFQGVNASRRALGSCLHLIQDSYARGHTHRHMKPGGNRRLPNHFEEILNFHTFKGQNQEQHKEYDYGDVKVEGADLSNIRLFSKMDGAVDAINASTKLLNFWITKTKWEDGVGEWLAEEIFKLSPDATPSNNHVD